MPCEMARMFIPLQVTLKLTDPQASLECSMRTWLKIKMNLGTMFIDSSIEVYLLMYS